MGCERRYFNIKLKQALSLFFFVLHLASCILCLASCILHLVSCILHLASCVLHLVSCLFFNYILRGLKRPNFGLFSQNQKQNQKQNPPNSGGPLFKSFLKNTWTQKKSPNRG